MQSSEESQGSLYKFKCTSRMPCKVKNGFTEREQARAVLGYYNMSSHGFIYFTILRKKWCFLLHPEGIHYGKIIFFQQLLKFVCTVNTGTIEECIR